MPTEIASMDLHDKFRRLIHNANPEMLVTFLSRLGMAEAKKIIKECCLDDDESALIHIVKNATEDNNKNDKNLLECCQLLLEYGADPNEKDGTRKTPLYWACTNRNVNIVNLLLYSGADPSIMDRSGFNSLHAAVSSGSVECVRLILDNNKELVNIQDENGTSPIITAVQNGDENTVQVLVNSGGDVNFQEKQQREHHFTMHFIRGGRTSLYSY